MLLMGILFLDIFCKCMSIRQNFIHPSGRWSDGESLPAPTHASLSSPVLFCPPFILVLIKKENFKRRTINRRVLTPN